MDFLSGLMLWGAAAGAIPVILHLTGRAKPILHKFPAMRFLLRSQRSSSRALRLKHLLLLLLRVLAIALLALTLARPRWPFLTPDAAALGGTLRGEYMLILDGSLSMSYKENETVCFEQARQQALTFLDRLAPEARVALVFATEDAEYLQGRLTLHHDLVRELISTAKPTGRGLDLARALQAARSIFEREPDTGLPRGVIFFTDLQKNAYLALQLRGVGEADEKLPPLTLVDVGAPNATNGAVLSAQISGQVVGADQQVALTARIRPVDRQRSFPVDLYLDGVKVAQRAVDPQGAEYVEVPFTFPAGRAGAHAGLVKLTQNDGLPLDQERAFAYLAGKPPHVLVVEDGMAAAGRSSGFFLRAALESPSAINASGLAVTSRASSQVHAGMLTQHQVVILSDATRLDEAAWAELEKFVEDGGGLFVWLSAHNDSAPLRKRGFSEAHKHHGLLPGRMGAPVKLDAAKAHGVKITTPDHALFARFTPGVRAALQEVRVQAFVTVTPELKDAASSVVLALSNGAPLLMEKTFGRGRVLLSTVAPDVTASDLAKVGEVFVTLTLEAARHLAGRGEDAQARLGHPLVLTLSDPPEDGKVTWVPPGPGEAVPLKTEHESLPAVRAANTATLLVPALEAPGLHRFSWTPKGSLDKKSHFVAANPASSEADLGRATTDEALKALAPWKAVIVENIVQMPGALGSGQGGREATATLLILVLTFLCAESFLSNRMYRLAPSQEADETAAGAPTRGK